ncbi:MAG: SdiA-regulated domain-containing protein [Bacteroidota bacterium]
MIYSSLFFLLISCFFSSCGEPTSQSTEISSANNTYNYPPAFRYLDAFLLDSTYQFPYNLKEPNKTVSLADHLIEISGLSLYKEPARLCAVQDENGIIFLVNKEDGTIDSKINFWKTGDYEGVEMVGEDAFVVKSSGTIYAVRKVGTPQQKVEKYNTFLGKENDVEGLCYDAEKNRLLLACKGRPATGKSLESFRFRKCIYGFSLDSLVLDSLPAYEIDLKQIQHYLTTHPMARELNKLIEFFTPEKENLTFNPSAIAIHPKSGNLYLTSSVGKVMIVLNPEGRILYMEKMKKKLYPQPEGLTFDPDGTLYISNEGKTGKAKIHRIDPKK